MTTIVNTPVSDGKMGIGSYLIGAIFVIGLVMMFVYVGIPAVRNRTQAPVNVSVPQVEIPDKVDINVTQTE